jgi:hypothetical protein
MIKSKDRSGCFGASDTHYIMGNFETDSFRRWWLEKCGTISNEFKTIYTVAGTYKEHQILDAVTRCRKDRQIRIPLFRLRINYDGDTRDDIFEVKTFKGKFSVAKYRGQVMVQMFGKRIRKGTIIAYKMEEEDYENFFLPIDEERVSVFHLTFDKEFIKEYVHRLCYLKRCLKSKVVPSNTELARFKMNLIERMVARWLVK